MPDVELFDREVQDWEKVSNGLHSWTQRKEVPGGWIYRTVVGHSVAMCFVPGVNEANPAGLHLRPVPEDGDPQE